MSASGAASIAASAPPGRGAETWRRPRAHSASSWWPPRSRRSTARRRLSGLGVPAPPLGARVAALGEDEHRVAWPEAAGHRGLIDLGVLAARVHEAVRQPPA